MSDASDPRHADGNRVRTRSAIGATISRAVAPPPANTQVAKAPVEQWLTSGAATADRIKQAQQQIADERAARQDTVFARRFRIQKPPAAADIVILDDDFGPALWEHELTFEPKYKAFATHNGIPRDLYQTCSAEIDTCPLCSDLGDKHRKFMVFLTCMDLRPYTDKTGAVRNHSKRILAIPTTLVAKFQRLRERNGTFRGMHLVMTRDTSTSARIGDPEFHQLYTEEQVMAAFRHPARTNQAGEIVVQENADCHPFDYNALFPKPSAEKIMARFRMASSAAAFGSPASLANEFGSHVAVQHVAPAPAAAGIQPAAAKPAGIAPTRQQQQPLPSQELDDDIPF